MATLASAGTVTYSDSIDLTSTNWSDTVSIQKFDASLGTLVSIEFTLSGHVEGTIRFESMDSSPTTVDACLKAEIELRRPDDSLIVETFPLASVSEDVTAYDGVMDWGGTSGRTYDGLSGDKTETLVSPPPSSDLALFTGTGSIVLPIVATGCSTASGGGNLISQFITSASAYVEVTYTYDEPAIPEPATLLLLVSGVSGLVFARSRR